MGLRPTTHGLARSRALRSPREIENFVGWQVNPPYALRPLAAALRTTRLRGVSTLWTSLTRVFCKLFESIRYCLIEVVAAYEDFELFPGQMRVKCAGDLIQWKNCIYIWRKFDTLEQLDSPRESIG